MSEAINKALEAQIALEAWDAIPLAHQKLILEKIEQNKVHSRYKHFEFIDALASLMREHNVTMGVTFPNDDDWDFVWDWTTLIPSDLDDLLQERLRGIEDEQSRHDNE